MSKAKLASRLLIFIVILLGYVFFVDYLQNQGFNEKQRKAQREALRLDDVIYGSTTTLLPDGRVLLVGGSNSDIEKISNTPITEGSPKRYHFSLPSLYCTNGVIHLAQIYSPSTDSWHDANEGMVWGRWRHTATLLPNNKVLVVGGCETCFKTMDAKQLYSEELYDPTNNSWSSAGRIRSVDTNGYSNARYGHTATLLPNGQVLITGGTHFQVCQGKVMECPKELDEQYDYRTNTWKLTKEIK
jgi:hypothetical protein